MSLGVQAEPGEGPELAENIQQLLLLQVEPGSSLDGELDDAGGEVIAAITRANTFSYRDRNTNTSGQTFLPDLELEWASREMEGEVSVDG